MNDLQPEAVNTAVIIEAVKLLHVEISATHAMASTVLDILSETQDLRPSSKDKVKAYIEKQSKHMQEASENFNEKMKQIIETLGSQGVR